VASEHGIYFSIFLKAGERRKPASRWSLLLIKTESEGMRDWRAEAGGSTKPAVCCVRFGHGSYPGSKQCSLAWVFVKSSLIHSIWRRQSVMYCPSESRWGNSGRVQAVIHDILLVIGRSLRCFSLSLCLIKHRSKKTYGRVKVYFHTFLTSVLDGGEWSASRHRPLNTLRKIPCCHWIGGWLDSRASRRNNISCPCRESIHDSLVLQSVV
jgi:hypothetical protein